MTAPTETYPAHPATCADKALAMALSLAHAENALHAYTSGQVDAIVDPSGKTYLLHGAQEDLRRSEAGMHALLDSASDLITVINRGGRIVSENKAAKELAGRKFAGPGDENYFDLAHIDDLQNLHSAFVNVIDGFRHEATLKFRHRTGDGSYRTLEAAVSKVRDVTVSRVVLICRDITGGRPEEEKAIQREAALVEESQAKDRFIAMLSHELRTPLSPVLLGVRELQEDERFEEAKPTLAMIRRNVDLQSRLLEELFDFTKIGQHKVRMRLEPIDAHEAVGFVLEICKAEIAAAKIVVLLDLAATEKMVLADSARLQQVMWNLVKNAVKFSTPGSSISITSANDAFGRLTLNFIDHGIGIEPELLPLVFEPFRQGNHGMPHHSGGLGLGLFIAKGMVEAQKGTLTVTSEGHDKGATFCVTLKAVPSESGRFQGNWVSETRAKTDPHVSADPAPKPE